MAFFDKNKLRKIKEREKTTKKPTIMLVDDETAHLMSMKYLLSDDYHIITAMDGQEAWNIIQNMKQPEEISLIISDQRMPNLTGIQLFEKLVSQLPNTIRIILTGFIDVPVILDAINKAKIHEFILKPFEPHDLLIRVKRAVEAFELTQKLKQSTKELERANKELEEFNLTDELTGRKIE